jgi:hypothetical protein
MDSIVLPTGKITVELGNGQRFDLGLTQAIKATAAIHEKHKGVSGVDWMKFAHLDDFQAWLTEQGGPTLSLDQLDALWDIINREYDEQKKTRRQRPTSPPSTESTPSD